MKIVHTHFCGRVTPEIVYNGKIPNTDTDVKYRHRHTTIANARFAAQGYAKRRIRHCHFANANSLLLSVYLSELSQND